MWMLKTETDISNLVPKTKIVYISYDQFLDQALLNLKYYKDLYNLVLEKRPLDYQEYSRMSIKLLDATFHSDILPKFLKEFGCLILNQEIELLTARNK